MDINEIIWPETDLKRPEQVQLVKDLCAVGTVTKILKGKPGVDGYLNMPYHYLVDGMQVEFLPSWGFFAIVYRHYQFHFNKLTIQAVKEAVAGMNKLIETSGLYGASPK
jgi:hypothetical protein